MRERTRRMTGFGGGVRDSRGAGWGILGGSEGEKRSLIFLCPADRGRLRRRASPTSSPGPAPHRGGTVPGSSDRARPSGRPDRPAGSTLRSVHVHSVSSRPTVACRPSRRHSSCVFRAIRTNGTRGRPFAQGWISLEETRRAGQGRAPIWAPAPLDPRGTRSQVPGRLVAPLPSQTGLGRAIVLEFGGPFVDHRNNRLQERCKTRSTRAEATPSSAQTAAR